MNRQRRSLWLLGCVVAVCLQTTSFAGSAAIDFNRQIRPILSEHCFHCHGPDAENRKADLRLDTEEGARADLGGYAAIVPGEVSASRLLDRIRHEDPQEVMPPPKANKPLSAQQIQLLTEWIKVGAPWQEHWAFTTPERPPLPLVENTSWGRNEIDTFILSRLEQAGLTPSPPADPATLLRRVSLDLNGLPPAVVEMDAFLRDKTPGAYERQVERLLHSPRYGEHMAWQWLEAARYADTDGYQNDGPREMWRWRDWVIKAYNQNMPFDQFTVEQLAGDLLPSPTTNQIIATGFNRNHRYNSEAGLVFEEFLLENAVDRVDTTATVWMGLTLGCARCHDHKYDPISQQEYYQLVAYYNNIPESGRAIKFGNSEPWIKAPTNAQQARLTALEQAVTSAEQDLQRSLGLATNHRQQWERSSPAISDRPLLPRHLKRHFAYPEPNRVEGEPTLTLGKIPHLICNARFSIAFDMTPTTVQQGAILSNESPSTGRNGILVEFHQGHLRFHIISRWIAGVATLETIKKLTPQEPVHVVLTNDGTQRAKGMRIFLNGERAQTRILHNSNSNKSGENTGDVMRIGFSPHVPSWQGTIEDLRFYPQHTLRPEEVAVLAEPTSLTDILALKTKQRTERQQAKLTSYYLSHGAQTELREREQALADARERHLAYYDRLPTTMVMEEAPTQKPTHIRVRGVYHQKGPLVQRGVPSRLPPLPTGSQQNRLGLAQWLTTEQHPLTARVVVNRLWQQLFGNGIVRTPEDFGAQGSLPTHPELLDWLAVEFVSNGWDLHHLIRKIVTSATYRQDSTIPTAAHKSDPENTLLSHSPRRRLSGNVLRDQALLLGGLLIENEGGPSVKPYQPAKLWREASNFTYTMGSGSDLYRRSLYTYWKRTLAPPSMALLDTGDREWCTVRLKKTNTPLQALTLLNEQAFFEAAVGLARRLIAQPGSWQDRIRFGFRGATGRAATTHEITILEQAFHRYRETFQAEPSNADTIAQANSQRAPSVSPPEFAATVAIANVLLNLDETTTRE